MATETSKANEELISRATSMFKLLSDIDRLKIVNLLTNQSLNVGTIAEKIDKEQSATSHQLKLLYDGNLLKKKRLGKSIYYTLADHHVANIIDQVMTHAEEEE